MGISDSNKTYEPPLRDEEEECEPFLSEEETDFTNSPRKNEISGGQPILSWRSGLVLVASATIVFFAGFEVGSHFTFSRDDALGDTLKDFESHKDVVSMLEEVRVTLAPVPAERINVPDNTSTTTLSKRAAPTLVPPVSPVASPMKTAQVSEDDPSFMSHLPFGDDLHYRRVCAPVYSSILCLTTRFPFEVSLQDPQYSYPRPVDERYYALDKKAHFIDGKDALQCKEAMHNQSLSFDIAVQACLDEYAASTKEPNVTAVSVWTRWRLGKESEPDFYGIQISEEQGKRIDQYFDKHLILVLGASPTPGVAGCLASLFGGCYNGGIKPVSHLCSGHTTRELGNSRSYKTLPMNLTYINSFGYFPADSYHGRHHYLHQENFTATLRRADLSREPGFTELRKLTLIVEYPFAHVQNQNMIFEEMDTIKEIQKGLPKTIMDVTSDQSRQELTEMGYELGHIIAYDGLPQFNPTVTGGYDWGIKGSGTSEEAFLQNQGYPGWIPQYGSKCRGPLPPTSNLTAINRLSREAFEEFGLDMKLYGRTWEFANQFWFNVRNWGDRGIDCTHTPMGSSMSCVHRYFLMTMVDDHFEDLEDSAN